MTRILALRSARLIGLGGRRPDLNRLHEVMKLATDRERLSSAMVPLFTCGAQEETSLELSLLLPPKYYPMKTVIVYSLT